MSEGKRRESSVASGPMMDKPDAQPVPEPVRTSVLSDDLVERWFVDHFYNVPGMSTELFNRFRIAADDLKARLGAKEP